jgi:triosephosphate isomerase
MIVLNLKTYDAVIKNPRKYIDAVSEVARETMIPVVICPPTTMLSEFSFSYRNTFAQHCDFESPGAHTGSIPPEILKSIGVKGSLLNHSEKRINSLENLHKSILRLRENSLKSIVCAATPSEMENLAKFNPDYLAVEPPELISSGISVSNARPEVISDSVRLVKSANPSIKVLCGAGVTTKEDVKKALEAGAQGVLLASAFVKSEDPKSYLRGLTSVF